MFERILSLYGSQVINLVVTSQMIISISILMHGVK